MAFTTPALAQERRVAVAIAPMRLDQAIVALGRQSGASIGLRDRRVATLRTRAVRGNYTTGEALAAMLRDIGARSRQVAPGTWLIEHAPLPPAPPQVVAVARPAAPPPPPPQDDIVVTGSKRHIPLGAYPGGVQIIDGASISPADAVRGSDAIEARAASVASTHLGPGRNKLFIRGIADSSFVGPTQSTVGQYWGNSRITYSAPDPSLQLHDIQSVEILEGPQGTLYGAGSLGGVVRIVPHAPDLGISGGRAWGGVRAIQHGEPGGDGGLVFNLPLLDDRIAFRGLAFGSIDGGYIDDRERHLKDINRVRSFGGRAAIRIAPGDDWTIDLSAVGQRILGDDGQYADRDGDGLSRASAFAQPFRNDYWLADLVAVKNWGNLELTSSLGIARQTVSEQFEGVVITDPDENSPPPPDAPPVAFTQLYRVHMITSETRLAQRGPDGTGWLIGVSLLRNEARSNRQILAPPLIGTLTGVRNRVDEATLFGEGTVEPIHGLTLTAGGRLTQARLSGDAEDVLRIFAFRRDPTAQASRSERRFLPSASLAWRPVEGLTVFGRYQQSFRPGGIAVRSDYIQRFQGDRVSTMEAGARYGDRAFDATLTASWSRWSHIQADVIDGYGFPTTINIGDGRVVSLGLSARWRPVTGLELDAALYLNNSEVTGASPTLEQLVLQQLVTTSGGSGSDLKKLPNVADASGRIGATYSVPVSDRLTIDASGYARYVGRSTLGIGPVLGQLQGNYLDTGLSLRASTGARAFTLTLTNLLDTRGNRFALGTPFLIRNRNQITPLQPRSIRLGFEVGF